MPALVNSKAVALVRQLHRIRYHLQEVAKPAHVRDEVVEWIQLSTAGLLAPGVEEQFDEVLENLNSDSPILEIGSLAGQSTNVLTHLLRSRQMPNLVFNTDPWDFERSADESVIGGSEALTPDKLSAHVRQQYEDNVRLFSGDRLPHTVQMYSDDFFESWSASSEVVDVFGRDVRLGGPISFGFIDGNHTYDFARRDFENLDKFLEVGGFVLFDDSAEWLPFGSARFMEDMRSNGRYELVSRRPNHLYKKLSG